MDLHKLLDDYIDAGGSKTALLNFFSKNYYRMLNGNSLKKEWEKELLSIFEEIGDSLYLFSQQDIVDMCKRDFPNKYKTMPKSHLYARIQSLGYEEYTNKITGKTHYRKTDDTTKK